MNHRKTITLRTKERSRKRIIWSKKQGLAPAEIEMHLTGTFPQVTV